MLSKAVVVYIAHLIALIGTPYTKLNCTEFILTAHGETQECDSSQMFRGCQGRMIQVGLEHKDVVEMSLYENELQPGDVLCFRGGHVAAYLGNGWIIDSARDAVGVRRLLDQFPYDAWYHGPVRVRRWASDAQADSGTKQRDVRNKKAGPAISKSVKGQRNGV